MRRNLLASAARVRGGGSARRPGRLRLVVVGLRRCGALSDARGDRATADLAVRDHEARLRAARARVRAGLRARRGRRCATSRSTARASVPTWRSPASSTRSRAARSFELYGDGLQSRSFTYVARRRWRRRSPRWSAPPPGSSTTSAAARRRRCARRSRRWNGFGPDASTLVESPAAAGDVRRTARRRDQRSSATSAGARRPRSKTACGPSGNGPRLESPRLEHARRRSRSRAGSRSRPLLERDRRALVASPRRPARRAF